MDRPTGGVAEFSRGEIETEIDRLTVIPERTRQSLKRYLFDRCPLGETLRQLVVNKPVARVLVQMDEEHGRAAWDITRLLHWRVPSYVWGTEENYDKWVRGEMPMPSNWITPGKTTQQGADR